MESAVLGEGQKMEQTFNYFLQKANFTALPLHISLLKYLKTYVALLKANLKRV
jgi:hypothetical protein